MSEHLAVSYPIGLLSVGAALAGFYAIVRAWKRGRFGAASRKHLISVVETAALTQHAVVQIVRIGPRYYALAGGAGRITLLCELPAADVEPPNRI